MYRIGIDLGGTNIAVGVVDDHHRIVAEASLPTGAHRPAEQVVADMCRAVELALDKAGLTPADCASIGVGTPGTCDPERGVVVRAYNLNWFDVPVCAMLTAHFGLPARLSNDANCAALAETVAGAAVGCRNMVLITLGTGVGGGIIVDGSGPRDYHNNSMCRWKIEPNGATSVTAQTTAMDLALGDTLYFYDSNNGLLLAKVSSDSMLSGVVSPSGKMTLLTKKKITMEMPPLRMVVPML